MPSLRFRIRTPRGPKPKGKPPFFVLEQDNWNDFGFTTQYHLYYYRDDANGETEEILIGPVKVLRRGQVESDKVQLTKDFRALDEKFCSLGQSLDYYERLSQLGQSLRAEVLEALRDVVYTPSLVSSFRDESGWTTSLVRDQSDKGEKFMLLARSLITGDYTSIASTDNSFSFRVAGWKDEVIFSFNAPTIPRRSWFARPEFGLPEGVAVLVGRNGSGKSTLLARLARVAFGTSTERLESTLKELGALEPGGIGFPRIITVSFSPFDSFMLPGIDPRDRRQVIKDIELGEGRFIFVGLRDIVAESKESRSKGAPQAQPKRHGIDRLGRTKLKSIERLADEFENALRKIESRGRTRLLRDVWNVLFEEPSFGGLLKLLGPDVSIPDAKELFLACSTGHKIVLLTTSSIIASIEPRSLILIDEPETHLHPPLLAVFMHSLRIVLRKYEALAIVATHSPVVVQESLAAHVSVVRREDDQVTVSPVRAETFGESIGRITAEVFGLQSDATDYHRVLDTITDQVEDLENIESMFLDGAMSQQARAYVMSRLSGRRKK